MELLRRRPTGDKRVSRHPRGVGNSASTTFDLLKATRILSFSRVRWTGAAGGAAVFGRWRDDPRCSSPPSYCSRARPAGDERKAKEAFPVSAGGHYSELVTQPSNGSEFLIAKGSDGGSKIASELSKGTRFQMFSALRVAGYHEFARAQAPQPFFADDIMETFDDFRAEEAFRLLAGMAATGQVI